jgi:hypothetical protein
MVSRQRRAKPPIVALFASLAVFAAAACGGSAGGEPKPDSGTPAPLQASPPEPEAAPGGDPAAEAAPQPEAQAEPEAQTQGRVGPITDAQREALHKEWTEDDLTPTEIHYIKSNERRHDVWFPYIADLGGTFVGVGSDQNYTVMAGQKAEFAYLMDIDRRVGHLHHVYEVLIEKSEDAETLHARWHADNAKDSLALLEEAFADVDESKKKLYLREYKAARETVWRHLRHVITRKQDGAQTSWLSNPEMYAHIRTMYLDDRVRILGGDLTGPNSLLGIGESAKALGQVVRIFYMSNAEEYFMYTPHFRANVKGLPSDEKSLTLRTIYNKKWEHADALWNYQVQPLQDFQQRMDDKKNAGRNAMIRYADNRDKVLDRTTDVKGLSRLNHSAPPS